MAIENIYTYDLVGDQKITRIFSSEKIQNKTKEVFVGVKKISTKKTLYGTKTQSKEF